jgi:hypothetical protein
MDFVNAAGLARRARPVAAGAIMESASFFALPTHVGSFPHTDPKALTALILERLPRVPGLPQMPVRDWHESMYVQYSEGLPGAFLDESSQTLVFRKGPAFYEELEAFYAAVLGEEVDRFAISPGYARGFHELLGALRARGAAPPDWVKGQVTGPFSFAMTVTDDAKRSLAYDPELFEVATRGMAMKARWVARELRALGGRTLVTLDEPYLCSYGSAFVNVSREEVVAALDTAADAIHAEGALAGLHCCGNTDWSLAMESRIDVLSLDAVEFFQGLPLYPRELAGFFERGGAIAWGVVPTTGVVPGGEGAGALLELLDSRLAALEAKGLARRLLLERALLTPTCGMGAQSVEVAERVVSLLVELAAMLRRREAFA